MQQQDQFTTEDRERAEALARPFQAVAAIFANAYTDKHSYDAADRDMLREAERDEMRLAIRLQQRGY